MQLVAAHEWGNPTGRVDTCPPALYSPWREPGVERGRHRTRRVTLMWRLQVAARRANNDVTLTDRRRGFVLACHADTAAAHAPPLRRAPSRSRSEQLADACLGPAPW